MAPRSPATTRSRSRCNSYCVRCAFARSPAFCCTSICFVLTVCRLLFIVVVSQAVAGSAARVDVQWLPYGSTAQLAAYASSLVQHHRNTVASDVVSPAADLVVLLVRMSDLKAAHPELASSAIATSSILDQLVNDLMFYDTITEQLPPLMLIMTPSPPDQQLTFQEAENALLQRVEASCTKSKRVHWRPSACIMELFRAHNDATTAFYDRKCDQLKHAPYTQRMLNALSLELCRQSCRLFRTPTSKKKVIVLDCDNTLWDGAVAERGMDGIALSEAFLDLQRFVVRQQQRGMLLCLCSKNVESDVVAVFEHRKRDMVLQLSEHVVLLKVNWRDKSSNIEAIARELSLGLDAFVFIDDNPVECSEVASKLPMISVINVPSVDAGFAPGFLDREWVFDEPIQGSVGEGNKLTANGSTQVDAKRTLLYQQNLQRNKLLEAASSHQAFLSSLGVKIVFEEVTIPEQRDDSELLIDNDAAASSSFSRVLQLHQRTNQFNIATSFSRALTHDKLAAYTGASTSLSSSKVICAHVTDRFGHYGLVSVILCRLLDTETQTSAPATPVSMRLLHVDSYLLSCRALNRGVEHAMIRKVAELAESLGALVIKFSWEPTDRNEPVRLFFSSLPDFAFKPAKHKDNNGSWQQQGVMATSRDEKLRWSAKSKGTWTIDTAKAAQVAFLKVEEVREIKKPEAEVSSSNQLLYHSSAAWVPQVFSRLVSAIIRVVRAIVAKIAARILPRWFVSFISTRLRTCRNQSLQHLAVQPHEVGLRLCQLFSEPHSLNAFIDKHTTLLQDEEHTLSSAEQRGLSMSSSDTPGSENLTLDTQEASKFRRKARHQTKLALLSHLNEDNPNVIWSANRKPGQSTIGEQHHNCAQQSQKDDSDASGSSEILIIQQQRPCSTPQCDASIPMQSQCEFQRCRTCCYKIQRLAARLRKNAHEKAKQTAIEALAQQFNMTLDSSAGAEVHEKPNGLCSVHQNARRRQ